MGAWYTAFNLSLLNFLVYAERSKTAGLLEIFSIDLKKKNSQFCLIDRICSRVYLEA